ncbi:MAG: class I adenylate-forming enzyme family protein [Burkholderiaceae bacterium]
MILSTPDRIREMRLRGHWPDLQFDTLLRANAARVPDREAIIDPPNRAAVCDGAPQRIDWRSLENAVERLADNLAACGLAKDDVALIQMANTWELLAVYLACFRRGIIASPVPALYREHELGYIIDHTSAKALFTNRRIGKFDHARMAHGLRQAHDSLTHLLLLGPAERSAEPSAEHSSDGASHRSADDYDTLDLGALLAARQAFPAHAAAPVAEVCADEVVTIIWTSGSEGRPKGIPRSHAQWLASMATIADACGMCDGVRLLSARPLSTHGAMSGTIMPWLNRAGTAVLHQPFTLELFIQQLRDEQIGFTSIAPAILVSLLSEPQRLEGIDTQRLHTVGSGSAPLSPAVISEFERRFGIRVVNFFGSTEGISLAATPDDIPAPELRATLFPRLGAGGFEWHYPSADMIESRLVDPQTELEITEPGRPGELRMRGATIFDGYFNDPDRTRSAFDAHGYYRSGDLFEIAGDGGQYYRYVGRLKEIIVRGGFNVSSAEVENLVADYPGVKEVGVIGMPDERLGERICAFIAMHPGAAAPTQQQLVDFLRNERHVASLKLPEKLIVLDALPRNANTKIDKPRLRELLARETG